MAALALLMVVWAIGLRHCDGRRAFIGVWDNKFCEQVLQERLGISPWIWVVFLMVVMLVLLAIMREGASKKFTEIIENRNVIMRTRGGAGCYDMAPKGRGLAGRGGGIGACFALTDEGIVVLPLGSEKDLIEISWGRIKKVEVGKYWVFVWGPMVVDRKEVRIILAGKNGREEILELREINVRKWIAAIEKQRALEKGYGKKG